MSVEHLPGTVFTPEVVLHRLLDRLPRIKGVVVVVEWEDGTVTLDWSTMSTMRLGYAAQVLQYEVIRAISSVTTPRAPYK